jgi:hypothetical protein
MVDEQERAASQQAGEFGWVRPVRPMGSAGHAIAVKVRVDPGRAFS